MLLGRGGDLAGARQSGPNILGRIVHRHHYFEILGFLIGGIALRRSHAAGSQDRGVADLGHVPVESLVGHGVDGHFRR